MVKSGPIFEKRVGGDKVNVLKLRCRSTINLDTHRYVGTADMCITKDPDAEWYNFGAYRCEVYDEKTIGCRSPKASSGRIHRDKYFGARSELQICHRLRPGSAALFACQPARCRAACLSTIFCRRYPRRTR